MDINIDKINSANVKVAVNILKSDVDSRVDQLAQNAAKDMKLDGFRSGKVPARVVKARFGDKLALDAQNELLKDAMDQALKELNITNSDLSGEPLVPKFEEKDDKFEAEMILGIKPKIDLGDYMAIVPEVEILEPTDEDIDNKIKELASQSATYKDIDEDRGLQKDDQAVFDFEGFVDGKAFDGGKAENYSLVIGSNQFIPGFEDGMIGLKAGEEKTISVKFPDDYQSQELKGKDSEFKIKLHKIQTKEEVELNEESIKPLMYSSKEPTLENLKIQTKEQLTNERKTQQYQDILKPQLLDTLIEKYDFDLPDAVLEAEMDNAVNTKARTLKEDELKELKENSEKLKELRESTRADAQKSVKLTFIVDALAKEENIIVNDNEVEQVLRYEAMMYGQDADAMIKQYRDQGLLPIVKMSMIEDRLTTKLLDKKLEGK